MSDLQLLTDELRTLDGALAGARADEERASARVQDASTQETRLGEVEAAVRLGELSEREATQRRAEVVAEAGASWAEHDRVSRAIEELRRRGAALARRIAALRAEEAEQRLAAAEADRAQAEQRLAAAERLQRDARGRVAEVERENLARLSHYDEATEKRVALRERQEREQVSWAVRHGGRSALQTIPPHLHARVEAAWAAIEAPEAVQARREAMLERARVLGEGVATPDGEVLVEPRRQPVAVRADPPLERGLKPGEQFPRAG